MKEDFKQWFCKKAGLYISFNREHNYLSNMIKAMWAINRENSNFKIDMVYGEFVIWKDGIYEGHEKIFSFKDYNNSEQEALEKALEYIYEQEK